MVGEYDSAAMTKETSSPVDERNTGLSVLIGDKRRSRNRNIELG